MQEQLIALTQRVYVLEQIILAMASGAKFTVALSDHGYPMLLPEKTAR